MDSLKSPHLLTGDDAANRPLFRFEGPADLSEPILTKAIVPGRQLTLSGPSEKLDGAHWPVRGDLAHIRLAGRCFVPHYSVPMPHVVTAPAAALRKQGQAQAEVLAVMQQGDGFDVLDMSGGWCWGQAADDGYVGYILHNELAAVPA